MKKLRENISVWVAAAVFALAILLRFLNIGGETVTLARLSRGLRAQGEVVLQAFSVLGQVVTGEAELSDVAAVFQSGDAKPVGGKAP